MLIGNTDMHIVTLLFIILETVMFIFQTIFYLQRPEEQSRKYYLILLFLLIVKNVAMGLFPDPEITSIPLVVQYGLTYGAGFVMASYFPYYFYKAYDIQPLKWHATRGIFIFLHLPFILIFSLEYLFQHDIDKGINYGLYIPAIYGVVLGYVLLRAIKIRYKDEVEKNRYFDVIAVYCAVIPYASLAFCAYFRISQVNEALLTNGGFIVITILFIRNSIKQSREEYERLQLLNEIVASNAELVLEPDDPGKTLEDNMNLYNLSERQKHVARLIIEGHKYREIGELLFISLATVEKHVEHISKKLEVNNRKELQEKLLKKV